MTLPSSIDAARDHAEHDGHRRRRRPRPRRGPGATTSRAAAAEIFDAAASAAAVPRSAVEYACGVHAWKGTSESLKPRPQSRTTHGERRAPPGAAGRPRRPRRVSAANAASPGGGEPQGRHRARAGAKDVTEVTSRVSAPCAAVRVPRSATRATSGTVASSRVTSQVPMSRDAATPTPPVAAASSSAVVTVVSRGPPPPSWSSASAAAVASRMPACSVPVVGPRRPQAGAVGRREAEGARPASSARAQAGGERGAGSDEEHDHAEQGLPGAAARQHGVADEHEDRTQRGQQGRREDDGVDAHEGSGDHRGAHDRPTIRATASAVTARSGPGSTPSTTTAVREHREHDELDAAGVGRASAASPVRAVADPDPCGPPAGRTPRQGPRPRRRRRRRRRTARGGGRRRAPTRRTTREQLTPEAGQPGQPQAGGEAEDEEEARAGARSRAGRAAPR